MKKGVLFRWLVVGLLMGIGVVWGATSSLPDAKLHLVACDVGQGDAMLLTLKSTQILVDGGPDDSVLDCLSRYMPFWDREIEVVVLTHPEADHMSGLVDVIQRYQVDKLVVSGQINRTEGFAAFRQAVVDGKIPVYIASSGDEIRIEPLSLSVLWPKEKLGKAGVWEGGQIETTVLGASTSQSSVNETSMVMLLTYDKFGALLTGDMGTTSERALLREGVVRPVDILKVAHHGSRYSSSSDFLRVVRPQFAIVSVGSGNRYGHPASETLRRLEDLGVKVLRTDQAGDVEVVTDGKNIWE